MYQLLIHEAKKQQDTETQINFLKKLEDIFESEVATREVQIELLKIKKQLALVLS